MKLSLAGLDIDVKTRFDYTEDLVKGYLSDSDSVSFSVAVSDNDISEEQRISEDKHSKGYLESIALYRKIAEELPRFDAVVFHGAIIAYKGKAYAFTARSGVGKTTHIRYWLQAFGKKVHVLNGDKPILRFIDGKVYACGTPWRGKEGYGVPEMLPLAAVGFIERAELPSAEPVTVNEALMKFASQIYIPRKPENAPRALSVLNKIVLNVPLFTVKANLDVSSAEVAFSAMTGEEI